MLQALDVKREHTVLDVGTGSGYAAALLGRLARRVYSIDRYRTLVERARAAIEEMGGSSRIEMRLSDGLMGWPEAAPFDRILLTGSVQEFPEDLKRQLAPGGIAVLPVERDGEGLVVRMNKQPDGAFAETLVTKARFEPLQPGVARQL
jgi:protein-L-isoaspartate(D-aspartate) O-methyltransferase